MIALVTRWLASLESRSVRFQKASGPEPEKTWINHALVVVILGGGLGGALGFLIGAPALGFRVGLLVALLAYLYREVEQWRGRRDKPERWWWDASLDWLFPLWVASPFLLGALPFYVLALTVALLHFALRPVE